MRTDEELRQLAMDYVDGRVFTDRHCKSEAELRWAFKPLLFAPKISKSVAMVYNFMSNHKGYYMNGVPSFFSMYTVNKREMKILAKLVNEYQLLRKGFVEHADGKLKDI